MNHEEGGAIKSIWRGRDQIFSIAMRCAKTYTEYQLTLAYN